MATTTSPTTTSSSAVAGRNLHPLDVINAGNLELIDTLYADYLRDRNSVDPQWAYFFGGFELAARGGAAVAAPAGAAAAPAPGTDAAELQKGPGKFMQIADLVHSYREMGHLIANLDPLGHNMTHNPLLELSEFHIDDSDLERVVTATGFKSGDGGGLRAPVGEIVRQLKETYCGTFAVEFMDIRDAEQRAWLIENMERNLNKPQLDPAYRRFIMERLTAAEGFETFLQFKFPSVKRFSNEGGDALIPLMDALIETGADLGMDEMVIGMAHRGRLNVLSHILQKPYEVIMSEVLGRPAFKSAGDGDVKYHLGYATDFSARNGQRVHLSLAANPSHLELINPIVEGMVRAKQNRKGDNDRHRTIPVLMHGDASFTGQGIVAETLFLSELEAYRTGGTVHIIINNQIGFTTNPSDARFTRYPTDIAKAIQAPVFHVNGDDPEAVVHAGRLAMEFRQKFKADVIIDLVCYRRRGHNEMDDASVTQPVMAREIAAHPTVRDIYAKRLEAAGVLTAGDVSAMHEALRTRLEKALEIAQANKPSDSPAPTHGPWANYLKLPRGNDWGFNTGVDKKTLKEIAAALTQVPQGFTQHRTVARMMENRLKAVTEEKGIDWGGGEMLALGSLVKEGTWVRLAGQDVSRGTFSHRNAVWFDNNTGRPYVPLAESGLGASGGRFLVVNSMLSEFAVVGFEYGFASADPQALVMWEGQFGDFVNMCQPIIDQFISSSESKWAKYNGLVMLLPHGYEGQGPEHSHARLERFLQLCAEDNMQVCYPTTPAQLFHMLRRQVKRSYRRPLIVMSPKSMLRNPLCVSTLDEFTASAGFQDWIDEVDEIDKSKVRRVLICSGKIYYDLLDERRKRGINDVAMIRLEQIYPFNAEQLTDISRAYPRDVEIAWVQEEPRNNGVYPFIGAKLHYHWIGMKKLYYIGRKPSASPAAGSHEQHVHEQKDIITRALGASLAPRDVREGRPFEQKGDGQPVKGAAISNVEVAVSKEGK
ncbi:MAG TPA: 2-oxoglutarate dehydrogenase E1 component [Phycisphaerae bacterium]|nr:2-oxoglutarate dehydrogenase E1 component [Phycisphaerae bacterium]